MHTVVIVVLAVVVIGIVLYVLTHARPTQDKLYEVPDDLKRADDNQMPPFDGSAGWMPPPT